MSAQLVVWADSSNNRNTGPMGSTRSRNREHPSRGGDVISFSYKGTGTWQLSVSRSGSKGRVVQAACRNKHMANDVMSTHDTVRRGHIPSASRSKTLCDRINTHR